MLKLETNTGDVLLKDLKSICVLSMDKTMFAKMTSELNFISQLKIFLSQQRFFYLNKDFFLSQQRCFYLNKDFSISTKMFLSQQRFFYLNKDFFDLDLKFLQKLGPDMQLRVLGFTSVSSITTYCNSHKTQ